MKKTNLLIFFILLSIGIFIRSDDLNKHFSHIDDIGVSRDILIYDRPAFRQEPNQYRGMKRLLAIVRYKTEKVISVPVRTTYAPLQFFVTPFFLSVAQDYRDVLFWSRFPSFIFSILGLLVCLLFYWKYDRFTTPAALISLTLLIFSWENIIYAKQSSSYSIGVFAVFCLLCFLWSHLDQQMNIKNAVSHSFLLALLSHTQYQILFFNSRLFCNGFNPSLYLSKNPPQAGRVHNRYNDC